jgi:PIN domain nuclease of toxin-antitoxin system
MRVLLDTNAFIWSQGNRSRYTRKAEEIFLDKNTVLLVSIVSVWEMAIKSAIGKLTLPESIETRIPKELLKNDIQLLQLAICHNSISTRRALGTATASSSRPV